MNNWKVIFATVIIFGAGVVTGGLLVNYVKHSYAKPGHRLAIAADGRQPNINQASRPADLPKPRQQDVLSKQFVSQLDDSLQLTPEQHTVIGKIVTEGQERNRTISTNATAQIKKVMQEVRQSIREQLKPEQLKPFEDLLKLRPAKASVSERWEWIKKREGFRPGTNAPPVSTNPPAAGQ